MYSLPSTSRMREPRASAKNSGTTHLARNGLLTPPTRERFALSSSSQALFQLFTLYGPFQIQHLMHYPTAVDIERLRRHPVRQFGAEKQADSRDIESHDPTLQRL